VYTAAVATRAIAGALTLALGLILARTAEGGKGASSPAIGRWLVSCDDWVYPSASDEPAEPPLERAGACTFVLLGKNQRALSLFVWVVQKMDEPGSLAFSNGDGFLLQRGRWEGTNHKVRLKLELADFEKIGTTGGGRLKVGDKSQEEGALRGVFLVLAQRGPGKDGEVRDVGYEPIGWRFPKSTKELTKLLKEWACPDNVPADSYPNECR
jgi:hypothetical protein